MRGGPASHHSSYHVRTHAFKHVQGPTEHHLEETFKMSASFGLL